MPSRQPPGRRRYECECCECSVKELWDGDDFANGDAAVDSVQE